MAYQGLSDNPWRAIRKRKDREGNGLLLGPALLLREVGDVGLEGCESGVSHLKVEVCGIPPDVISMAYQSEGVNPPAWHLDQAVD